LISTFTNINTRTKKAILMSLSKFTETALAYLMCRKTLKSSYHLKLYYKKLFSTKKTLEVEQFAPF